MTGGCEQHGKDKVSICASMLSFVYSPVLRYIINENKLYQENKKRSPSDLQKSSLNLCYCSQKLCYFQRIAGEISKVLQNGYTHLTPVLAGQTKIAEIFLLPPSLFLAGGAETQRNNFYNIFFNLC